MNHVGEKPADPLTLLLHPTEGSGESVLYEDAGNGFGYERGEYSRRALGCEVSLGEISIRLGKREGSFVPERSSVNLELRGIDACPRSVTANGEETDWSYQEAGQRLIVLLAERTSEVVVKVHV
jgi:alpha-glucosidase